MARTTLSHIIAQGGFMEVSDLQLSTFDDLTTHHPFWPDTRAHLPTHAHATSPRPTHGDLWGTLRTEAPEIHACSGSMTDVRRELRKAILALEATPVLDEVAHARWRRLRFLAGAFKAADARRSR